MMRMKFSIRDCLWLTAITAILLAWWLNSFTARYTIETSSDGTSDILQDNKTMHRWVRSDDTWLQVTW
jgi:hypothetical protein